jgi:hypothetical protein
MRLVSWDGVYMTGKGEETDFVLHQVRPKKRRFSCSIGVSIPSKMASRLGQPPESAASTSSYVRAGPTADSSTWSQEKL